jgi:hypothetical protein
LWWASAAVIAAALAWLAVSGLREPAPAESETIVATAASPSSGAGTESPGADAGRSGGGAGVAGVGGGVSGVGAATGGVDNPGVGGGDAQPGTAETPAVAPVVRTAKEIFDETAGGGSENPGLLYRLIQRQPSGQGADVDAATTTFRSGDGVRFAFTPSIDGFLYVAQAGSSGRWTVLFPSPEINDGRNQVRRRQEYLVPDNGWFDFDDVPGTEEVFVILSREPLDAMPGFRVPVSSLETVQASVVEGLQKSVQPRDLVFQKTAATTGPGGRRSQATYVVNREELASRVTLSMSLAHER